MRHRVNGMHRGLLITTAAVVLLVTACGNSNSGSTGGGAQSGGGDNATIALLLPESKTTRYEQFDKPIFEAKVKSLCANCKVLYSNADQDPAKQQSQVESALTQGAKVLVLDAVDAATVAPQVNQAKQKNVPVIAYDRLISGIGYEYYVSFDN